MQSLSVTLIQTNLAWEDKAANMRMLEKKIRQTDQKTELVILPEMFTTGFSMNAAMLAESPAGDTITWLKQLAEERRVIITGSIIIKEEDKYFNRLVWVLPTGETGSYDKRHLFGYAKENNFYEAGVKRLIAQAKGWRINLLVCYDLRFPVWSRNSIKDGIAEYDLLIYVANWPARRSYAWKTLLCARAIENQCYVIGVNRTGRDENNIEYAGDSMVIDPLGKILYHKKEEEDIFTITLDKQHLHRVREQFPFLSDADKFNFVR